jgi:uncharacterized protein (DUF2141 family)
MILLAAALLADTITVNGNAPITIQVHNVRNNHGRVRVAVCPRERFLAESCPWHADAAAQTGTTTIVVPGIPPGDYAVQAFHDENNNDRIDTGMFGIPKEGVGFSRDARILFGPPKWRDAVFSHTTTAQTISFSLRYFTGPGTVADWKKQHPLG